MKNNSGQAVTELALFGSVLLFTIGVFVSYGMRANYQQSLQMRVFRQAEEMAKGAASSNGPMSATYMSLQDKPMPDVSQPLTMTQTQPFQAGASVTWNHELYSGYSDSAGSGAEISYNRDASSKKLNYLYTQLPQVNFNINGIVNGAKTGTEKKILTSDLRVVDFVNPVDKSVSQEYKVKRKVTDLYDKFKVDGTQDGPDGIYYYWKEIDVNSLVFKVQDDSYTPPKEDLDADGKEDDNEFILSEGSTCDIDKDGKEESMVKFGYAAVTGDNNDPMLGDVTNHIAWIIYEDSQEGDINQEIDISETKDKNIVVQGVSGEYNRKGGSPESYFYRNEKKDIISTEASVGSKEYVTRYLITQDKKDPKHEAGEEVKEVVANSWGEIIRFITPSPVETFTVTAPDGTAKTYNKTKQEPVQVIRPAIITYYNEATPK